MPVSPEMLVELEERDRRLDIETAVRELGYAYDKLMVTSKTLEDRHPEDTAEIRLNAMIEAVVNIQNACAALGQSDEQPTLRVKEGA